MDMIWWTKVTNASRFLDQIINYIQDGQSVLLQLPKEPPWRQTMQNIVATGISQRNATSTYKSIQDTGQDPGEFLFYQFCREEKRAHYRPGIGYAEFLAKSEEIVLNECILWISGAGKDQAKKWYNFVGDYNRAKGKAKRGCIFLIETCDDTVVQDKKGIRVIRYQKEIEHYDCYIFSMMAASGLKGSGQFKRYLAEVVSGMFPEDVEMAAICISYGREFLEHPIQVIQDVITSESRSDGSRFQVAASEGELQERIWEAQIKVVFPLVEKHRNALIRKYQEQIGALLPIHTAYGEVIEEASNVELGILTYLSATGKIRMAYEDAGKAAKLKETRNILAHIRTLPQEEVDAILALETGFPRRNW